MKVKRLEDGWWIVDVPEDVLEMGPYDTKAEALDDMRRVQRTIDSLRPILVYLLKHLTCLLK